MDDNKNLLDMRYVVFGPDLNANSDYVVGPNGIARRGTPQAEWVSKPRVNTTRPETQNSKLQAIKPIQDKKSINVSQSQDKATVAVEVNQMKSDIKYISLPNLVKNPVFRWAVLCVLLAVLIYCLWPRGEYVSMGNSLILNKRTGEVHRACDRIKK